MGIYSAETAAVVVEVIVSSARAAEEETVTIEAASNALESTIDVRLSIFSRFI